MITRLFPHPLAALFVSAFLFAPMAASHAGVTVKNRDKKHSVYGDSARELVRSMYTYAIRRKGDAVTLAELGTKMTAEFKMKQTPNSCRMAAINIHLDYTMTLPQARHEAKLDKHTLRDWKQFQAFVKKHEAQHRTYQTACAKRGHSAMARLSRRTCGALEKAAIAAWEHEMERCKKLHASLDRRDGKRLNELALMKEALREPSVAALSKRASQIMNDPTTKALLTRRSNTHAN